MGGNERRNASPWYDAWWLTANPSDLRNPLVLDLAGVELSHKAIPTFSDTNRRLAATSNPAAVAKFLHHICNALSMICFDPRLTNLELSVKYRAIIGS